MLQSDSDVKFFNADMTKTTYKGRNVKNRSKVEVKKLMKSKSRNSCCRGDLSPLNTFIQRRSSMLEDSTTRVSDLQFEVFIVACF